MRGRPRWSDRPDGPSIRLEEWLARTPEDAIEPELPIIDSHHHLWDPAIIPAWRGAGQQYCDGRFATVDRPATIVLPR